MKQRLFLILMALALAGLASGSSLSAAAFDVLLLPPLETAEFGEFPGVSALRLNDRGDAVGQVHLQTSERVAVAAFRYTAAGGMENLDPLGSFNSVGWLINNTGLAYGSDFANRGQAAIFLHDGTGFDFIAEDMERKFERSIDIVAMNDNGDLLGHTGVHINARVQPYRYTAAGGWEEFSDIDPRLGRNAFGDLLNNRGDMVLAHWDDGVRTSFVLTAAGELLEIPDLGGGWTQASAMNESAQVVGDAYDEDGTQIGFLFSPQDGVSAIRRNGFKTTEARYVTADGTVAGTLAKKRQFRADTLFVQAPGGKPKVVVKRRQFKRLTREAGFDLRGIAVHAVNDRLEFVGSAFNADDPFEPDVIAFVYSRELGLRNLQEALDEAGIEGRASEAWDINALGQILVGVHTEERGTTAILTPIP